MLITTEVVTDALKAAEILRWYSDRWHVEEYHKILKSGCHNFRFWILDFGFVERLICSPLVPCALLSLI